MCCLVTITLKYASNHVLKRCYEASSRGHEVKSYFVTSQNHVTLTTKSFMYSEHSCGTRRRVWRELVKLIGVHRTVNLPGLVAVSCAVREL